MDFKIAFIFVVNKTGLEAKCGGHIWPYCWVIFVFLTRNFELKYLKYNNKYHLQPLIEPRTAYYTKVENKTPFVSHITFRNHINTIPIILADLCEGKRQQIKSGGNSCARNYPIEVMRCYKRQNALISLIIY